MKIKRSLREYVTKPWFGSFLAPIVLLCLLFFWTSTVQAATLESAFAIIFEKLNANIAAQGEVVAVLPEKNEVIVEFSGDLVPSYGSELLIFGSSVETDEGETGSPSPMVYRGFVTVRESAGHLNRAIIDEGGNQFAEGDQVFLPAPVLLYITPVKNLTPNPYFTSQATQSIGRLLSTFSGLQVFSLPASNHKTVNFLQQKCRHEGRYGMVLQPFIVFQNGRTKAQIRIISLFSGQSLGAIEDEFAAYAPPPPPQSFHSYR